MFMLFIFVERYHQPVPVLSENSVELSFFLQLISVLSTEDSMAP